MAKFVRLKPFDPRKRHLLRTYMHGPTRQSFDEARGWYSVDEPLAAYLAKVHQVESDPESPSAFDVCSFAEAQAIDARERKAATGPASAADAVDLSTSDLGENRARARAVAAAVAAAENAAPEALIPKAQKSIRRGVRQPQERSMRPAEEPARWDE
jgi:hypothetical protein